jgi:hypothetical protein
MSLHQPAIDRIKKSVDSEGFLNIFNALEADAEETGVEVGQVCMPYIVDGDEFVAGTWVPELWLVVRKVLSE